MLLGKPFAAFVAKSPVSIIVQGTLERVFDPQKLEQVFDNHAIAQYTKELTFADCVGLMSDVVFRVSPSVGAWYKTHQEEMPVSRQAVYDKLKHLELPVSAALVRYSATTLLPVVREMAHLPPPFLAGYRVRVLDGNHLAGTEHRLLELRRHRAAALPGQTLVFYDPQFDLVTNVIPCEDAHAQERSLLARVLEGIATRDCVLADRNFCTLGFLFGIHRQGGFFIIRQHASLPYQLLGPRRRAGQDSQKRAVYEQAVCLIDPHTGETHVLRRITIALLKPTKQGDTELHVLTNLPPEDAEAVQVTDRYADRWTIEQAFQHLTEDLQCEIDTLGYPKAALFGFCVACVAYNVVSLVKSAIRAAWGRTYQEEQLSMYYLALEVAQVCTGLRIVIEPEQWGIFRTLNVREFAETMVELARQMNTQKYTKHKRGPKKPQPKKISGKRHHHVSTARLIAARQ
jgi:Transposase DDE domain